MGNSDNLSPSLVLLKLGGSLITDKIRPRTPRLNTLSRLANEIASALRQDPSLHLIMGHGAGSFGHVSANKHGTRQGVSTPDQWRGFAEVWWDAATLNRMVIEALLEAGLPAISLPPSASVLARDGEVASWDVRPLKAALEARLLPVIYGDVIFDTQRGGTILSTEDLFSHLVGRLLPGRMLLAGIEPGVWGDYPNRSQVIPKITTQSHQDILSALRGSAATDVTGGMESKVKQGIQLISEFPNLEILIFSGDEPGILQEVLLGARKGTVICRR
jgi:isopentenyl phosphate kinase